MSQADFDRAIFRAVYEAATHSPDPSTQLGAAITYEKEILAIDFNRFPFGFKVTDHLVDRDKKLRYIEHAERTAVYKAASRGKLLYGAVMYAPGLACMECARSVIFSGIKEVVIHAQRFEATPERWKPSVMEAWQYLADNGVKIRAYDGPVGGPPVLVDGKLWQP